MKVDNRDKKIRAISSELLTNDKLPLFDYRIENGYLPVMGEGNYRAEIMLVGEAPGENEAKTGRPFCGASGRILDEALAEVGIRREDVYITNIVKDRPPGNRDPLPEEISVYAGYLDRQVSIIRPKIIVTLGRFSTNYMMRKFGLEREIDLISVIHGRMFKVDTPNGKVIITPLYHPAATIYDQTKRSVFKGDLKTLVNFISTK